MIWEQNTATIVMVTNLKERKEVGELASLLRSKQCCNSVHLYLLQLNELKTFQ